MYAEVAWVLVSSGTQVQPQIIPDPDYLPDYLSVSYDYDQIDFYYYFRLIIQTRRQSLMNQPITLLKTLEKKQVRKCQQRLQIFSF